MNSGKGEESNESIASALTIYSRRYGSEASAELLGRRGHILEFGFSGNISQSCCASDYFDDLAMVLEEATGVPHAVWHAEGLAVGDPLSFRVRIVELGFLDKIQRCMAEVEDKVRGRLSEFEHIGMDEDLLFSELSFCVLTANFTAEGGLRIQREIGAGFRSLGKDELAARLRSLGHRFPNTRAAYIVEDRALCGSLLKTLKCFRSGAEAREWLVNNVKGFGQKEASHFLRNIGFKDVAIIDRHILRFLSEEGLIEIPKSLSRRKYLSIEILLQAIAGRLGITLAELDLVLWYMMTGRLLK
jgi:N-glycosylase/DNA lyase